jgi:hypothetical protein
MNIKENLNAIKRTLPDSVTLVAVSKTQPVDVIREAYDAGQRAFGENRAQELEAKHLQLPGDIEWHMIGHLQSNKVKYIAPFVSMIHSVDSPKLLSEIQRQGEKCNRTIPCLLQVHIADEETKFGFSEEEIIAFTQSMEHCPPNVEIVGLMGMATFTSDTQKVRLEFRKLKSLFETLKKQALPHGMRMQHLSMGMSGDYSIAIEEGSTLVRIGTSIFGVRH